MKLEDAAFTFADAAFVSMVCNNCGAIETTPEGGMYECRSCGWGDGWGEDSREAAERRAAKIVKRGRLDG